MISKLHAYDLAALASIHSALKNDGETLTNLALNIRKHYTRTGVVAESFASCVSVLNETWSVPSRCYIRDLESSFKFLWILQEVLTWKIYFVSIGIL